MLSIYSSINFIAGFALGCFGAVIYAGSKSNDTRAFSYYIAWVSLWAFSLGTFLSFDTSRVSSDFMLQFLRYQYWLGIPITSTFFYFSLVYQKGPEPYQALRRSLMLMNVVLLGIYLKTDLVITHIILGPRIIDRIPDFGPLGFALFNIPFAFFTLFGLGAMYRKWQSENSGVQRRSNAYLFWSSVISFLPGVILAVILPLTNDFESYWLAPPLTLAWVFFTSYVIFRHQVLRLTILTGELLFFVLLGILFINIFLTN